MWILETNTSMLCVENVHVLWWDVKLIDVSCRLCTWIHHRNFIVVFSNHTKASPLTSFTDLLVPIFYISVSNRGGYQSADYICNTLHVFFVIFFTYCTLLLYVVKTNSSCDIHYYRRTHVLTVDHIYPAFAVSEDKSSIEFSAMRL